jgi:hypothetical protein
MANYIKMTRGDVDPVSRDNGLVYGRFCYRLSNQNEITIAHCLGYDGNNEGIKAYGGCDASWLNTGWEVAYHVESEAHMLELEVAQELDLALIATGTGDRDVSVYQYVDKVWVHRQVLSSPTVITSGVVHTEYTDFDDAIMALGPQHYFRLGQHHSITKERSLASSQLIRWGGSGRQMKPSIIPNAPKSRSTKILVNTQYGRFKNVNNSDYRVDLTSFAMVIKIPVGIVTKYILKESPNSSYSTLYYASGALYLRVSSNSTIKITNVTPGETGLLVLDAPPGSFQTKRVYWNGELKYNSSNSGRYSDFRANYFLANDQSNVVFDGAVSHFVSFGTKSLNATLRDQLYTAFSTIADTGPKQYSVLTTGLVSLPTIADDFTGETSSFYIDDTDRIWWQHFHPGPYDPLHLARAQLDATQAALIRNAGLIFVSDGGDDVSKIPTNTGTDVVISFDPVSTNEDFDIVIRSGINYQTETTIIPASVITTTSIDKVSKTLTIRKVNNAPKKTELVEDNLYITRDPDEEGVATTAKEWRVLITATKDGDPGTAPRIAQLIFNTIESHQATFSSGTDPSSSEDRAFDGLPYTNWLSSKSVAEGAYIGVIYDNPVPVESLTIEVTDGPDQAYSLEIQYKSKVGVWENVRTVSSIPAGSYTVHSIPVNTVDRATLMVSSHVGQRVYRALNKKDVDISLGVDGKNVPKMQIVDTISERDLLDTSASILVYVRNAIGDPDIAKPTGAVYRYDPSSASWDLFFRGTDVNPINVSEW